MKRIIARIAVRVFVAAVSPGVAHAYPEGYCSAEPDREAKEVDVFDGVVLIFVAGCAIALAAYGRRKP